MRPEHLFVIDPLASLNLALDSSLRMMFELAKRGHGICICEPQELGWVMGARTALARCRRLSFKASATDLLVGDTAAVPLGEFSAVHMRKDPPYDLDYVSTTWLLDAAGPGTRVYNDPGALRRYNEKLAILLFPEECREAMVSADPGSLLEFIETRAKGDGIVKPLTLFGGRGVERIQVGVGGREAALTKLTQETGNGRHLRLVQAFDPLIFQGEVRAFTAFGEPLAWCLKRPAPGQFLANTRMGAVLEPYSPAAPERERVTRVAKALLADGVALAGFDLIGGYVSEINLTSPRLLQAPADHGSYYARFAELVEQDLAKPSA